MRGIKKDLVMMLISCKRYDVSDKIQPKCMFSYGDVVRDLTCTLVIIGFCGEGCSGTSQAKQGLSTE